MNSSQLSLDLPILESRSEDDFLISGSNRGAAALIGAWPEWPGGMAIVLGPRASGKSHLAAIWAERSAARDIGRDTPADEIVGERSHVLIDDADRWREAETLLHVVNATREARLTLLMTGVELPDRWPVSALADLRSRLAAAPRAKIETPDEGLLTAALAKIFADRQLRLERRVIAYLVPRMPRTLAAAREIATQMDRRSLTQGRKISIPLAREILEDLS